MAATNGIIVGSWIRQLHRWVAIAFTATVITNFIVRAKGTPPPWVTYSPLLPLAVLLLTGLYLFVLPYIAKWRTGRGSRMRKLTHEGRRPCGPGETTATR
jgi:hypothetical protein